MGKKVNYVKVEEDGSVFNGKAAWNLMENF